MKKLQNNFTTPEQSKRLLELGVPANSADCYYVTKNNYTAILHNELFTKCRDEMIKVSKTAYRVEMHDDDVLPCWSIGRLIEVMTICYKWDLLSCASFRIYVTDIIGCNLINQLINDLSLEISRGKMDFSKLED